MLKVGDGDKRKHCVALLKGFPSFSYPCFHSIESDGPNLTHLINKTMVGACNQVIVLRHCQGSQSDNSLIIKVILALLPKYD